MRPWKIHRSREMERRNHWFFKKLMADQQTRLNAPADRERRLVATSWLLRNRHIAMTATGTLGLITVVIGLGLSAIVRRSDTIGVFMLTAIATTIIVILRRSLSRGIERTKARLLTNDAGYLRAVEDALRAQAEIDGAWDAYNVNYRGYPPDWDWRKDDVKLRDGRRCTACGWPAGARRRRRNLHVHHRVPLARGGDNSFANLTTLCHVCHRNQEGTGHKRIKYRRPER